METFLFSDEAGCFTFNRNQNVSRYFIICTVTVQSLDLALSLTRLRHQLLREGLPVGDYFHATTDAQAVRDRVFAEIVKHDFTYQVTICEKSKAQPQVTRSKARFYQYPWFYHFRHGVAPRLPVDSQLMVTAASIGSKKEKATYVTALQDVIRQSAKSVTWAVDFRPAMACNILQVADYCAWATQRFWEMNDKRSLSLIEDKCSYSFELWKHGTKHYY